MFTYFHDHKNKYNKGQLAPIYILILVIVIIMAMVTVNLSKVAMVKTDTSNSADAGAIATGAIMANAFNSVAVQNSKMITTYWSAYASIAVMFSLAFIELTLAFISATSALATATATMGTATCVTSCAELVAIRSIYPLMDAAMLKLGKVVTTIYAIGIAILGASIVQHYYYASIRKMAIKGRGSSIRNGHGFVFSNSGTGQKLKAGSSPADAGDSLKGNGYRDSYVNFLDGIGDNEYYIYSWKDGQDRSHSVDSRVHTNKIEDFELTVAVLPSLAETAALTAAKVLIGLAETGLFDAKLDYIASAIFFDTACIALACCSVPATAAACCPTCEADARAGQAALIPGVAGNTSALFAMTGAFALLVGALAGLLPGPTITASGEWDDIMFFDCWINDIKHDHLVRVDTKQSHQGGDLGLWKSSYPDTASYAVVDFSGSGSIFPPNPRYGSDIVEVDSN
ncbi:MAG: pilus assembly protein TadG-related protein [Candidatus Omnitrophica bacterium]|nr:pilus assembly protein TadG-related protein [Candidatus Omnitrophota bacterium]